MALLVVMNVTLGMTASASEVNIIGSSEMIVTRATGKFSMSVPANTLRKVSVGHTTKYRMPFCWLYNYYGAV